MTFPPASFLALPTPVAIHLVFALGALVLGPLALRVRKGTPAHRGAGYAWVLLMAGTALSSFFIRGEGRFHLHGYSFIHLLSVTALVVLAVAIVAVMRRRIETHRRAMKQLYLAGCIGAGVFTLLPGRYLGSLVWHHGLGLA